MKFCKRNKNVFINKNNLSKNGVLDCIYFILIQADQIKENEVGRTCGTHGRGEKVYKVLVGKPEGKIPLGRPRHRWEDGIRMELQEIGWGSVEWIHLAQD
jgi:hypothetical protein